MNRYSHKTLSQDLYYISYKHSRKNLPNSIAIEWNRPTEYGDGFISEYHLKVGKYKN